MTWNRWGLVLAWLVAGGSLPSQEPQASVCWRFIYIDEVDQRDRQSIVVAPDLAAQGAVRETGAVEGFVRGQDGELLRNVEVFAADQRIGGKVLARSRTDGNGMFVLGHLPLATCYVLAHAPDTTTAVVQARLNADHAHVAVDLRVYEANTIRGRVVDGLGEPIAGAQVMGTKEKVRWGLRQAETRTDADGRFELAGVPIGLSTFRIWKPGYALKLYWLTTSKDAEFEVTLGRGKGTQLEITTEGLTKDALAATQVSIYANRGKDFAIPSDLQRMPLGADGSLQLRGLPDAQWTVSLRHPTFAFGPGRISTKMGDRNPTLHFVASEYGGVVVKGTLVDTNGKPLAGQELLSHPLSSGSLRVVTDELGRFSMATALAKGDRFELSLARSSYVLNQRKYTGLSGRWEAVAGAGGELQLVAERAARVEATLVDSGGVPMPLVAAQLQIQQEGRWRTLAFATSRRDGTVQFPSVRATEDDCRIYVGSAGVGDPFRLQAGRLTSLQAEFPSPGVVKGQVLDSKGKPLAGVSVLLGDYATDVAEGWATMHTWIPTDRQGRFVIPKVAAGFHAVSLDNIGQTLSKPFEVEAGGTIVVNLTAAK